MKIKRKLTVYKPKKFGELFWLFGMLFVSIGVAICGKADLGVSMISAPPFIINEAVSRFWSGSSVGTMDYIFQGILIIALCISVWRVRLKYFFSFSVAVIFGLLLDLWFKVLGTETFGAIWLKWIMLIVGDSLVALGVACFFRTYLPLEVHEMFVFEISKKYRFNIAKTKMIYDFSLLALSIVLALSLNNDFLSFDWSAIYCTSYHYIGLGTVVTTVINAPIIAFFGKMLDRIAGTEPLSPKLKKFFSR